MSWYSVEVRPDPERRDSVAAWLVGHTGQAIEERDDGTLVSFALDRPAAEALEAALGRAFGPVPMLHSERPDVDWTTAWREGMGVRRVGRVAVTPSWVTSEPAAGEAVILIDPQMAFGSGEHGSTRAALALVDQLVKAGDRVVDLGCGSGILSIAAVRLGAARAVGIEVDADSVPVALENVIKNGVADRVTILEGEAAQMLPFVSPADLIVSNILRLVNVALLPDIAAALSPGGIGIFSGMETKEADSFRAALAEGRYDIVAEVVDAGWWAVAARPG